MKYLPLLSLLVFVSCTDSETSSTTRYESGTSTRSGTSPQVIPARVLPKIINTTDSIIRHDEFDQSRVLVGPSKKAQIMITKPGFHTANFGFCSTVKKTSEHHKQIIHLKKILKERTAGLKDIQNKKEELLRNLEEARARNLRNEVDELQNRIDLMEIEVRHALAAVEHAQTNIELEKKWITFFEDTINMDYLQASVEWKSDWEKNIETLKKDNPDYDFENETFLEDIRVKMTARGLEEFPAHQMIRGFVENYGIEETVEGLKMDYVPFDFKSSNWLTGYGACPLSKPQEFGRPAKVILIDVEFEF